MAALYFGIASGELLVMTATPLRRTPFGPLVSGVSRRGAVAAEPPFRSRPHKR